MKYHVIISKYDNIIEADTPEEAEEIALKEASYRLSIDMHTESKKENRSCYTNNQEKTIKMRIKEEDQVFRIKDFNVWLDPQLTVDKNGKEFFFLKIELFNKFNKVNFKVTKYILKENKDTYATVWNCLHDEKVLWSICMTNNNDKLRYDTESLEFIFADLNNGYTTTQKQKEN